MIRKYLQSILLVVLTCIGCASCHKSIKISSTRSQIELEDSVYDFGKLKLTDSPVTHDFILYNSGKEPLVINSVETSCHCSTASFTKQPIASGESGSVTVTFDPRVMVPGTFHKTISIYSNTFEGLKEVTIQGIVTP